MSGRVTPPAGLDQGVGIMVWRPLAGGLLPLIHPHWHQAKTARDRLGAPELTLLGPRLG